MNGNPQEDPQELIESLRSDIEVCKEILEQYKPCPENIMPQLWSLNEKLKRANAALEEIRKMYE